MAFSTKYSRLLPAFSLLLLSAYPLQPDFIITKSPLNLDAISSQCRSSSCWIGIAHDATIFLDAPLVVPYDARVRLSAWPLFGRAALVAVNGSQLVLVQGALSLEALDLFGSTYSIRDGGCIAAGRGARLNITNSSLNNCTSFGSGGAILVGENAHALLHDIRALDSVALDEGGLIYAAHNASVIIEGDSILSLASATSGGLISIGPFAMLDIGGNTVLSHGTAGLTGGIVKAALGARVTLRNYARLEYGVAQKEGGCVYGDYNGIIDMQDNTTLRFCSAGTNGGGIYSKRNVSLSGNAVVSSCTARRGGGILIVSAVVEIRDAAEIVRCVAIMGGGVRTLLQARIVLRDSAHITACTADHSGGGVYTAGPVTLADDAVISNCSALRLNTGQGGGIYGPNGALVELRDRAQVVDCRVQGMGGCISALDIIIADTAHVGNCIALNSFENGIGGCLAASSRIVLSDFATLSQCHADYSGCFSFYQMGTILLSGNAVVSDCTAVLSGAVVMALSNATVILRDDATITRAYSGYYGTFFLKDGSSLLMTGRAKIHDCVAQVGSAVYADQTSLAIRGHNTIVNCSGAAFFLYNGATLMANGLLIKNCSAHFTGFGGGIDALLANVALYDVVFEACFARAGGAVYATYTSLTMEKVRIAGCSAPTDAGGIYLNLSNASIFNSVLQNNHADRQGGCLVTKGSRLVATNTIFELCSSGFAGGGIVGEKLSNFTLIDAQVRDCWSTGNGGGVSLALTTTLQLRGGTTISNCYGATWGGGIFGQSDVFIEFSDKASIVDSAAGISGGGCYLEGSSVMILRGFTGIMGSRASSGGGCGVHSTSILMLLDQASIVSAIAEDNGGGVFATDGSIVQLLNAALIANSSAGGNGGAVAAQASTVYMRGRVVISRNRASLDGGGIALEGASQLFVSSSSCRWFEFNLGFTPASALISTGGDRLNKPDAVGQSMLVHLSGSNARDSAIRHFCLWTKEAYSLEAYSPDALGWGGATASVSSDPQLAYLSTGSQVLSVNIILTVERGDHAKVQHFVVAKGKPDYEGGPVFESNKARRGGALAQLELSTTFIQGTSFTSNAATSESSKDGGGGACFLDILTILTAYDTSFQNNNALSTGGAIDALPKSAIVMSRVTAVGNKASGSGGYARLDSPSAGTTLQQCALSRNEALGHGAEGGAMLIADAPGDVVVHLKSVTFEDNQIDGTNSAGGGLAIRSSNVNLEDVHFSGNEARLGDGGALALLDTYKSTVSIISDEACAEVTIEIDFRFTSATCLPLPDNEDLLTCDSIASGCAAYQSLSDNVDATFTIDDFLAYLFSQGLDKDAFAHEVDALKSDGEDALASDEENKKRLQEYNAILGRLNRTATACAGCACWVREERYIVLRNSSSQIAKVTPRAAAVIEYSYCLPPGTYELQAYDELGESWWNGTSRLVVNGREYDGLAVTGNESSQLPFFVDFDDAAIPLSTMEKNTAWTGAGGAVFIDDGVTDRIPRGLPSAVKGLETNIAYYGSAVASPARRLQAASLGTVHAESGYLIPAGSLVVELVDSFDQRCTSIDQNVAAVGNVSSPSTFTNNLAVFAQGVASFDRAILSLYPGGTLVVNISSSLTTLFVSQATIRVAFTSCSEGSFETPISTTTSKCVPCGVGSYWWKGRCHKCREGMDCSEPGLFLNQVPVHRRRYRTTSTSKHVYKCPSKGSGCPGGRGTGENSCAEGYAGVLCAACERGYYLKAYGGDGRIRCSRCDDSETRTARAVLIISGILLFSFIILLLLTSYGQQLVGWILAQPDPGELGNAGALPQLDLGDWDRWHFGSGLIKLKEIVAIYQMLASMRDIFGNNFEIPSVYAAFSMFMRLLGLDMDRILPIRCLVQNVSNLSYYIYRLIVIETLPLAAVAVLFAIAQLGRTLESRFGLNIQKPSYRMTVQMAFFVVHVTTPTSSFAAISSLVCDKYDYGEEGSRRFLRVATYIDCDCPIYQNKIHLLGVFGILIFPTAVVIAYTVLLYRFRVVLNNTDTHWNAFVQKHSWPQKIQGTLEFPQEAVKKSLYYQRSAAVAREAEDGSGRVMWFQFLWSGYRPDCYMFELVDLAKRLIFTALLSLFWPSSRLQMTLALLVAICFVDFYTRYRPFLHRGDELLAAANNWVLAVSQLVGLMINARIGFSTESVAAKVLLVGAACVPIVVLVYVLRWWFYSTMLIPFVDFVGPRLVHCIVILRGLPSATYELFSARFRTVTRCCRDIMYRPVDSRDSYIEMKYSDA